MEFGLEEEGNAADGTYRQVATAIGHDITAEEVAEVIDNDVAYTGIAQMVVARHETVEWEDVEVLSDTDRGAGGWGSTGNK